MRVLRKGQAESFYFGHPLSEMRLVSRVFEMLAFIMMQELCPSSYLQQSRVFSLFQADPINNEKNMDKKTIKREVKKREKSSENQKNAMA